MLIAEAAEKYGLSKETLRYYERVGLIPTVARDKNGVRNYGETDCAWIEFIKCMRSAGLSIDSLAKYVALSHQGEETYGERKQLLITQRDIIAVRIAEMQTCLERLNRKIKNYDTWIREAKAAIQEKS